MAFIQILGKIYCLWLAHAYQSCQAPGARRGVFVQSVILVLDISEAFPGQKIASMPVRMDRTFKVIFCQAQWEVQMKSQSGRDEWSAAQCVIHGCEQRDLTGAFRFFQLVAWGRLVLGLL